MTPIKGNINIL